MKEKPKNRCPLKNKKDVPCTWPFDFLQNTKYITDNKTKQ